MPTLVAKETTYECSPEEIAKLIASDLGVPVQAIAVTYVITSSFDYDGPGNGPQCVSKVRVTVDNNKVPPRAAPHWEDR
jgi:2C-methyl-D-erythritol 2,4-cyclodiphosphate synthase